jgi:Right handed beta helix region
MSASYTVLLLLCLGSLTAQAATFYVSPQGNDSRTCAQAQNSLTPRRTINGGIPCLASGDTLIIGGGTYDESISDVEATPIASGTSWSNATTLKAAPGETVWLKVSSGLPGGSGVIEVDLPSSQYIIFDGLNVDANGMMSSAIGVSQASKYIRFQNMEVKHGGGVGFKIDGQFCEVLNVDVHHSGFPSCPGVNGCHGLYISGWYNLFDRLTIHDNPGIGITFSMEGGTVLYNTIQRSTIYNNRSFGILAFPYQYIYNNVVYNNGTGIKMTSGAKAIYNVVYNNGDIGIWPEGSGQEIKNNIVLGHRWDIMSQDTGSVEVAANICTAVGASYTIGCTLAASPATVFHDISVKDFHLRAGSLAIGVGMPLSGPGLDVDKDGVPRPLTGPVDVGAYQYMPRGPVIPAPQQLRAVVQ